MNKKLTAITILGGFIILLLTMALAPPPANAAYDPAMQAYWRFDETSGQSLDSSGHGISGDLTYTVNQNQPGKYNRSYSYAGFGHVNYGSPAGLTIANNITTTAWVNVGANNVWQDVVYRKDASVWLGTAYNKVFAWTGTGSAWSEYAAFSGNTTFSQNAWHFVALTYSNNTVKLYLDGFLDGSKVVPTMGAGGGNVTVGGGLYGSYSYSGSIDETAVFNTTKSGADIYSLYVNGIHQMDVPSRAAEINSYLTGSGLTFTQVELEAMASAAINDPAGTITPISGNISHYEPLLMGNGISTDQYFYDFSSFTTLDANSWAWGTGALSGYSSLNDWYLKVPTGALITADGNAIVAAGESWFLKTGGGNGTGVPEIPAGVALPLLALLGSAMILMKKRIFGAKK